LWLRGGLTQQNQYRAFEKVLNAFPFSKLSSAESTLRITAVNPSEPPLAEYPIQGIPDAGEIIRLAKEFPQPDSSVQLETYWDLWNFTEPNQEWELGPASVSITMLGLEFERDEGEDFRIEFGSETRFLPTPGAAKMTQENVRSLLRLVHELDDALPLERRRLSSESGENFAEKLQRVVQDAKD
jgi:hypothetical protein